MLPITKAEQVSLLKKWENKINSVTKEVALIKVENEVDLDGPPADFTYINDYMPASGITIPDDPPMGCECKVACGIKTEKMCCPSNEGQMFPYTKGGRVRVRVGTPIFECNKKCKCPTTCTNRVVQKGRKIKLSIFKTSNGCGWGVKVLENVKRGTFIAEYLGEIITNEEAEIRGKTYDANGRTYLFDLDCNLGEENKYTVDAAYFGNVSHFVNHSCDPNVAIFSVWINCLDVNLPRLALFALRDIIKGEEITFDYCQNINGEIDDEAENRIGSECFCGTSVCRKVIF